MSKISQKAIEIIYGPSIAYSKVMIIFGIPIAAAAYMSPPSGNYFDPLILLIIPAWCLYIYVSIFTVLRKPRTSNFTFILGIDYHYRSALANRYINRKLIESFLSILPCAVVFLPIRLLTVSLETNNDTYFICLGVCIEYCCMVILLKSIGKYSLIKPEKYDSYNFKLPRFISDFYKFIQNKIFFSVYHAFVNTAFNIQKHSLLWTISSFGIWGFNRKYKALIRRQWLYLFRYEWISFSAIFSVCLLSGTYLSFIIPPESNTLSISMIILFPMIVFLFTTRTFGESAQMIRSCPYYNVTRRDLVTANMVISSSLVLPYIVLIFIRIWIFCYPFVNIFPVIISFFSLVYLHAYRSVYTELGILGIFQLGVSGISVSISVCLAENNFIFSLGFACIPILFIIVTNRVFSNFSDTS